jgi:hypothetical protein
LARGIWDALEPWTTLVRETIRRLLDGTPYGEALSPDDLTSAVTALFLGIELLTGLDPNGGERTLFTTMEVAAAGIDALLRPPAAATDN